MKISTATYSAECTQCHSINIRIKNFEEKEKISKTLEEKCSNCEEILTFKLDNVQNF